MKTLITLSALLIALSFLTLGCASDRNVSRRSHISVGTGGVNVGVSRSADLPTRADRKEAREVDAQTEE